jgi:hypothetical protein
LFLLDGGSVLPNDRLHKIIYTLRRRDADFAHPKIDAASEIVN